VDSHRFDLPFGVRLRVQSRSGRVHVIAEEREDVQAETDALEWRGEDDGAALLVRSARGGSKPITVRCPVDTDVIVGTQSGSVRLEGKLGDVSVTTMSGSIEVDDAGDADLRTMSGKVALGTCRGRCRISAVSGTVTGGDADSVYVQTISGNIAFKRVFGDVRVRSVSGSVDVMALGDGAIAVKTVSGKVRIAVPEGTAPKMAIKTRGKVFCECEEGSDCRLDATSMSGTIEVVEA